MLPLAILLLSSLPVENDLSSRQINSIFQDSKGFIWIGTADGLNLYNANSVKIFKHDIQNKNSIHDNNIQNVCEDKKGNIWIANATGIDCYNPATHIFIHYTTEDQKKPFRFKPKVFADRKGNIWVGSDFLFRFDTATLQFEKIINPYSNKFLGSKDANLINGFFQDSKDRYWVSTFDGLFLFNNNKKTFTRVDSPPVNENYKHWGILFGTVTEDNNGELRVGSWGHGLYKISITYNSSGGNIAKLLPIINEGIILYYTSQQLGNKEIFWFSNNGLASVDEENKILSRVNHQNDDPFSLRNNTIKVLFADRQNQLWIGYDNAGIQILSPGNQLIKTYPILSRNHTISAVEAIAQKNTFFYLGGWYNNALCKLDKNYKVVKMVGLSVFCQR